MSQKDQEQQPFTLSGDAGPGTAVTEEVAKKSSPAKRKPKQLPPFKVLLHNDDVNTFEHVIASILKVMSLQPEDAILRTLEAHETGVALLIVTHLERAELYQEQFATFKLTVSIEPA
jgi:ATP-dependent Clp protease adaptor protein ClpS